MSYFCTGYALACFYSTLFLVVYPLTPFTAPACRTSGLKDAGTRLQTVYFQTVYFQTVYFQTVYFPILQHLLLMLCVVMKVLSNASAKRETERLKVFIFRTFAGRFQATSWQ